MRNETEGQGFTLDICIRCVLVVWLRSFCSAVIEIDHIMLRPTDKTNRLNWIFGPCLQHELIAVILISAGFNSEIQLRRKSKWK